MGGKRYIITEFISFIFIPMNAMGIEIKIVEATDDVSGLPSCLQSHFAFQIECGCNGTVAEKIASIIFGSNKTRIGNAPSDEQRSFMIERVQRFVNVDAPIEMIAMWAAVKGFGHDPDRFGPDIMDLLGIRRFAMIANQVKAIYAPGMNIRLVREDIGERVLTNNFHSLNQQISTYCNGVDLLCKSLGIENHVRFEDESDILSAIGIQESDFLNTGNRFAKAFNEYWIESEDIPAEKHYSIPALQWLIDKANWQGIITPDARSYYLDRARNSYPDLDYQGLVRMVCVYLGYAKARSHFNLLRGQVSDSSGIIPAIRGSLVPYPKGSDPKLSLGRVTYKLKDSRTSNNAIAPWCGFGVAKKENSHFNPSILPATANLELLRKVTIQVNGVLLRSDILDAA